MRERFMKCAVIYGLLLLAVPAPPGVLGAQVVEQSAESIPFSHVFVLNPSIIYEDARNEQNLQKVDPAAQLIFDDLSVKWAADVFPTVGMEYTGPVASGQTDTASGADDMLQKNAEDLVKQWKDKKPYLEAFREIREKSGADCLLVQFIKVKVGDQGSWDFVCTGRVTPTTSSTTIKLALIDLNTGNIYWSDAAIEHYMPDMNNGEKLYKAIYGNFPGYKTKSKKGGKK